RAGGLIQGQVGREAVRIKYGPRLGVGRSRGFPLEKSGAPREALLPPLFVPGPFPPRRENLVNGRDVVGGDVPTPGRNVFPRVCREAGGEGGACRFLR